MSETKLKVESDGGSGSIQKSDGGCAPGIITTLAELPEKALLDEGAMGRAFGVAGRTIRRMVTRHELPPPIPVAGRSVWIAGRVLAHLEAAAERAAREAERAASKIRSISR